MGGRLGQPKHPRTTTPSNINPMHRRFAVVERVEEEEKEEEETEKEKEEE